MSDFPAITGKELIRLLVNNGWEIKRKMTHGIGLTKYSPELGRILVTCIPDKNRPLSKNTLTLILGSNQSRIGMLGLKELIAKNR
jgi:hypothetical protein